MSTIRFNPFLGTLAGDLHDVVLLPQRAVYWPARRTLLAADLHFGKSQTFWAAGAPVPDGILDADLAVLDLLLTRTEAARLMILGDLLHSGTGLTPTLIDRVAAWRDRWRHIEFVVIPGNHDRCLHQVAGPWQLAVAGLLHTEDGFAFRHDPAPTPGAFTWSGHIHPLVRVSTPRDSLRLPCFWMCRTHAVLPALSAFTRGVTIRPDPGDAVFAIADDRVVAI